MRVEAKWTWAAVCALGLAMGSGCSDDGTDEAPMDSGMEDSGPEIDAGCQPGSGGGSIGIDPAQVPNCPASVCEAGGGCIPNNLAGGMDNTEFLAPCNDSTTCVPDEYIEAGGEVVPEPCESLAGLEGRCLSKCLPIISNQVGLPQSTCDDTHLCAPCYDPLSGEPTGACSLGCDEPQSDPVTFDTCCGGIGSCISTDLIPDEFESYLGEDTCPSGEGSLCVPQKFIEDFGYTPPSCDASATVDGGTVDLGPGACLALCVAEVTDPQAADLSQSTCDTGEVCVPCTDPNDGTPTGACDLGTPSNPDGGVPDAGLPDGGQ